MSDGMDELQDLVGHMQGQRQIGATNDIAKEVRELRKEIEKQKKPKGPKCPFCGGIVPMKNAELCTHCRSNLSWVEGVICKPGQEQQLLRAIEKTRKERAEKQEALLAENKRTLYDARREYRKLENALLISSLIAYGGVIATIVLALLGIFMRQAGLIWGSISLTAIALTIRVLMSPGAKRNKIKRLEARYGQDNIK